MLVDFGSHSVENYGLYNILRFNIVCHNLDN